MNTWYAAERWVVAEHVQRLHAAQDDRGQRIDHGVHHRSPWRSVFTAALAHLGWFARKSKRSMKAQRLRPTMIKPRRGMTLAFTAAAEADLADISATVINVWPRCRSGDYLVTLEYRQAVQVRDQYITQIEAFTSELYVPTAADTYVCPPTPRDRSGRTSRLLPSFHQVADPVSFV